MSDAKHTPGPWYVGAMNDALFIINEPPRPVPVDTINTSLRTIVIAKVGEPHSEDISSAEAVANARLIAASPELLEACRQAKKYLEPNLVEPGRTVFWNLVSAIAKAEGRAQ